MSALAGVSPEQFAAIVRLIQNGFVPGNLGAQTLPQAVPQAPAAIPPPANGVQQHALPAQEKDADIDKEEGELEDGEDGEVGSNRAFLRPPPTGPRQRSTTPRAPIQGPRGPQADRAVADGGRRASLRSANTNKTSDHVLNGGVTKKAAMRTTNGSVNGTRSVGKATASKAFVLEMHREGYTFEQLAKEVPKPKPLQRMFNAMDLPLPAGAPLPVQADVSHVTDHAPSVTARQQPLSKRPLPPKPAAPVDRPAYLAKLQAAKNKRPEPVAVTAKPVEPAAPTPPATQRNGAVAPSPIPTTPAKRVIKTEVVKQRLEALRAEQAEKVKAKAQQAAAASSSPAPVTDSFVQPLANASEDGLGLGSGVSDLASKVEQMIESQMRATVQAQPYQQQELPPPSYTASSPIPPTPTRSLSGLPGLFMGGFAPPPSSPSFAQQSPNQPTAPPPTAHAFQQSPALMAAPLTVPRKRPVAADFDTDLPATTAPSAPKRPLFGESRSGSENEQMIIEVSDDDDEEDEDEMDTDQDGNTAAQTTRFGHVGRRSNFPSRASFLGQVSSSTPGTPGGNDDYERKMKEIEEIKRKIAEKEARKLGGKANGSATPLAPTNGVQDAVVETASPQVGSMAERPMSAAALARKQEKEKLQQRLLELQLNGVAASVKPADTAVPADAQNMSPDPVEAGQAGMRAEDEEMAEDGEIDKGDEPEKLHLPGPDDKIGSQATTASATTLSEATPTAIVPGQVTSQLPMAHSDVTMSGHEPSLPSLANVNGVENARSDENEDDDGEDDFYEQSASVNGAAPEDLVVNDAEAAMSYDLDSHEEGQVTPEGDVADVDMDEQEDGEVYTSSASSTHPSDYEPELEPLQFDAVSDVEPQPGQADQTDLINPSDDLAPELQPPQDAAHQQEVLSSAPNQVRGEEDEEEDWSHIY